MCYESTSNFIFERLGTVVCANKYLLNYRREQAGKEFRLYFPLVSHVVFMCRVV
jgi:hypothetical protein